MGTGENGKMTVRDMVNWCQRRFDSGQFDDPYVMVPLDGLKALVDECTEPKRASDETSDAVLRYSRMVYE